MQNVREKFGRKYILDAMLGLARLDSPGIMRPVMGQSIGDGRQFGAGRMFHGRRLNCWDMQELRWVDNLE